MLMPKHVMGGFMRLFHGTTLTVDRPIIINRFTTLDFGTGFYTTSNEQQAVEFAKKAFTRRGRHGSPTVNVYEIEESLLEGNGKLRTLRFDGPNVEWLHFVVHNRKFGRDPFLEVDVVVGPVANDNVFRTIDMYESGDLTEQETIERFKINEMFDQYLFCNEESLNNLRFVESYEVD